jgi:hypothetical protein
LRVLLGVLRGSLLRVRLLGVLLRVLLGILLRNLLRVLLPVPGLPVLSLRILLGVLLPVPRLPVLPLRILRLLLALLLVAAKGGEEPRRGSEAGEGKSDGAHAFIVTAGLGPGGKKHESVSWR